MNDIINHLSYIYASVIIVSFLQVVYTLKILALCVECPYQKSGRRLMVDLMLLLVLHSYSTNLFENMLSVIEFLWYCINAASH